MNFKEWWTQEVENTAPTIQNKAEEYGSNSLAQVGHLFGRAQGRTLTETQALEAGCAVYAYGKLERVLDSLLAGKQPSTDTWHDLQVYAAMANYIRQNGDWP